MDKSIRESRNMKFVEIFLSEFYQKFKARKIILLKIVVAIVVLLAVSLLVEISIFSKIEKSKNEIVNLNNSEIIAENFKIDERGIYISEFSNARLIISNQNKYVKNLEILLAGNPNLPIIVKYLDSKTDQESVLKKELQKSMKKNDLEFFNNFVFDIKNSPEKIIIEALEPQTEIVGIRIDNNYYFNLNRFIFIFALGGLILILFALRKKAGKNPELIFLAIALIGGSLISILEIRSFVSFDEKIHYQNVNRNSFRSIIKKDIKDIYSSPATPSSYSIKEQSQIDQYFNNRRSKEKEIIDDNSLSLSISDIYKKLGYLPSICALVVGRILHLPAHIIFVLGRWVNILVFSLVVFLAIRKLKSGKMILSIIALFPTSIFLASHYNYDSWVTAFTMLGLAYLFSELQQPEKKITWKEITIMIGALVIGLGPKAIYFPLLFLLFFLTAKKFNSKKQYRNFIIATILSILFVVGSFVLPMFISGPGSGDSRGGGNAVNPTQQIGFILSEPFVYAKILFVFLKNYINLESLEAFMTNFVTLGKVKGFWIILTLLAIVTLTDKNQYDKNTASLKLKFWVLGVCVMTFALIATALYITFTPVGNMSIAGVQHRYLIPLVFPVLFIIGSSRIKNPVNKNVYNMVIFSIIASVLLGGIWDLIVSRYY